MKVPANNPKAPRMSKAKFAIQIVTRDLWKRFVAEVEGYENMSFKEFRGVWEDIAETIREEAITNPLGVKLGSYTGELKYQYLPYKVKSKDFNTSDQLNMNVNHLGITARGKQGIIKWERRWACKRNKMLQFFGFQHDRRMERLAKEYTEKSPEKIRISRNTLGGKNFWK